MRVAIHVLQQDIDFDAVGDDAAEQDLNLLDGDYCMKHAYTTLPGASVGAICATTWVVVEGGRIYFEVARGGSMKPRFFPGSFFRHGTEVLTTPDDAPSDGVGGTNPPA